MAGFQSSSLNALDILESALPSSALASIDSEFSTFTSQVLAATSTQSSSQDATASTSGASSSDPSPESLPATHTVVASRQSSLTAAPTSRFPRPTGSPASLNSPSSTASTANPASASSRPSSPSTLMTIAAHPFVSSTSAAPSATSAAASSTSQLADASVAGIASGLVAGAVVLFLIGLWLWRQRGQGKLPFSRKKTSSCPSGQRSGKRYFPESAWLYDPVRTPHNASSPPEAHHDRSHPVESVNPQMASTANLIAVPEPRKGVVELASAPPSPPLDPRASSPLLASIAPLPRAGSPEGRKSGSRSPRRKGGNGSEAPGGRRSRGSLAVSCADLQRPMSAIWEEPSRPENEVRQGLLDPGHVNVQCYST